MNSAPQPTAVPDRLWQGRVTVVENVPLARDTYRVRFDCPQIARRIAPGQFIMLRLPDSDDPLLGRPLALYDTVLDAEGNPQGLDIAYLVVGKLTRLLARCRPGAELEIWGPLGNGFPPAAAEHLVMVAGGIGLAPFMALARAYLGKRVYGNPPRTLKAAASKVTLLYGARSGEYLAAVEDFRRLGVEVRTSTLDGSAGHHGFVTELLEGLLDRSAAGCRVVSCGPEPMMEKVAELTARRGVDCQLSLETPMACGIGICFSCVTRVRDEAGGWDYRRTCVEGPVFDARQLVF